MKLQDIACLHKLWMAGEYKAVRKETTGQILRTSLTLLISCVSTQARLSVRRLIPLGTRKIHLARSARDCVFGIARRSLENVSVGWCKNLGIHHEGFLVQAYNPAGVVKEVVLVERNPIDSVVDLELDLCCSALVGSRQMQVHEVRV